MIVDDEAATIDAYTLADVGIRENIDVA